MRFFYFQTMQFSTKISIPKSHGPIDYDSDILSVGSCFAVNIAEKFDYFQFRNWCNPFGILFHPLAIRDMMQRAVEQHNFTSVDLFLHNGLWHGFELHSELSQPDAQSLVASANHQLERLREQLTKATHVIITYGTAWVYREKASQRIVANCHKVPQANFTKELLSVETIAAAITETKMLIRQENPAARIIFTVSPIRHLKDGFVENQRSKAHLIAAIHEQLEDAEYFPSYEIMMDELRDYRFYAEDMLHPNATAIEYIWQRFSETHITSEAQPIMKSVDEIRKSLQHKPFHPDSESHQQFLSKVQGKARQLQLQFPHMQF